MGLKADGTAIALLVTLVLFGVASFWPLESMWGINHLRFAPEFFTYAFAIVCLIVTALLLWPQPQPKSSEPDRLAAALWGRQPWLRLGITAGFVVLFYLFRTETHFLGDGYTLISLLAQGEEFRPKWVQPGSTWLVRQLQMALGGYTRETAAQSLQISSVISGALVVYGLISIAGKVGRTNLQRLFNLVVLLSSGALLLFFGYIEYYPMVWAAVVLYFNSCLTYLQTRKHLVLAITWFLLAVLMHLEVLAVLGGLIVFLIPRLSELKWRRLLVISGFSVFVAVVAIVAILPRISPELSKVFLPFFSGSEKAPDYAVFSIKHLLDIGNLLLLICPSIIVLGFSTFKIESWQRPDATSVFLFFSSVGALLFLLVIDPVLGMGRDWDLMSVMVLPVILFLLHLMSSNRINLPLRIITATAFVSILITSTFLYANVNRSSSENRFRSLLEYYGRKDEAGWSILTYYYLNSDRLAEAEELAADLVNKGIRPFDNLHILAVISKRSGQLDNAEKYYREALTLRPYDARKMNELGQLYLDQGRFAEALRTLKRAHVLEPSFDFILEGIGLTYFRMGHLDSARMIADSLFVNDQHSPGGHLLMMVTAINAGDAVAAKWHLQQYLRYGKNRSDYERIKQYYNYLLELS